MSQAHPQRPQAQEELLEPIKYGNVCNVFGELANKPITPQDAADMQAAENLANLIINTRASQSPKPNMPSGTTSSQSPLVERKLSSLSTLINCGTAVPGSVAAKPQAAACHNIRTICEEDKTKLGDILAASILNFLNHT
ncbi:hypothetical protein L1887_17965 [Cichorium endivia]|nr:hypothetical protein L1887_17965 [Cichorium endivia]